MYKMRYNNTKDMVGDLKWSIMNNDHEGWVECNGRSLSRRTYAELFKIIGTSFGSDSATTFNLPDCRGRGLAAIGQGVGLTNRALGGTIGEETHALTVGELPAHSHSGTTAVEGDHTHTSNANGGSLGLATANGTGTAIETDNSGGEMNIVNLPQALTINTTGAHSHAFTSGNTGLNQRFNVFHPTIFIGNVFILSTKSRRF
jgi:microcystin-dependent protein